jgi:asparagine synthase (glutamine-hydrolysing)
MQVPVAQKLGNLEEVIRINENEPHNKTEMYFRNTRDGKLLLRNAMRRYVPEEVASRQKQGFSAPDASWFKGESIDYLRRTVFNDRAMMYEFLDPRSVRDLVADHLEGRQNRRLFIWSLLSFEQWCQTFLR